MLSGGSVSAGNYQLTAEQSLPTELWLTSIVEVNVSFFKL